MHHSFAKSVGQPYVELADNHLIIFGDAIGPTSNLEGLLRLLRTDYQQSDGDFLVEIDMELTRSDSEQLLYHILVTIADWASKRKIVIRVFGNAAGSSSIYGLLKGMAFERVGSNVIFEFPDATDVTKMVVARQPARIFLSAPSEDYDLADQIHDRLISMGHKPFLASRTLKKIGDTDYMNSIDHHLQNSDHMLLILSTAAGSAKQWVKVEWQRFIKDKLDGRKTGNFATVLTDLSIFRELNGYIQNFECVTIDNASEVWLRNYLNPPSSNT